MPNRTIGSPCKKMLVNVHITIEIWLTKTTLKKREKELSETRKKRDFLSDITCPKTVSNITKIPRYDFESFINQNYL